MRLSSQTRFFLSVAGGVLLSLAAASAEAATINWATWASGTPGATTGSAVGTLPGLDVSVSYSGQFVGFDDGLNWQPTSTFTGALIGNAPPSGPGVDNDGIMITGGAGTGTNTITFSTDVTNPIVAIWSLGQAGLEAQFVFASSPLHIRGGGANSELGGAAIFSGGSCPTGAVCGIEGNGLIHFRARTRRSAGPIRCSTTTTLSRSGSSRRRLKSASSPTLMRCPTPMRRPF